MATFDFCSKNFSSKQYLKAHIDSVHHQLNNFQCPHCPKRLGSVGSFRRHVNRVHLGLDKAECPRCLKTFSEKKNLSLHIAVVHDKLKPFECSVCLKKFGTTHCLYRHISSVHKKVRPFLCPQCFKTYGDKRNLQKHIHKHQKQQLGTSQSTVKLGARENVENQAHNQFEQRKQEKKIEKENCSETLEEFPSVEKHTNDQQTINSFPLHFEAYTNTDVDNGKPKEHKEMIGSSHKKHRFYDNIQNTSDEEGNEIVFLKEIKQTSDNNNSEYECDICNEVQANEQSLKDHFQQSHATDRAFCCKICKTRFTEQSKLKLHHIHCQYKIQWKPLNVITSVQAESDNITKR
jgi:hypothetical protein